MKNLIRKILKEEEGFLDSSKEDWEWVNDYEIQHTIDSLRQVLEGSEFVFEFTNDDNEYSGIIEINDKRGETYIDFYVETFNYQQIINEVLDSAENCEYCGEGVQEEYQRLYNLLTFKDI